jgi:iron complex outermembrane receptor protein
MKRQRLASAITAVLASTYILDALAQPEQARPHLEEVLVQAQRTTENLQTSSVAVSVVSDETLRTATVSGVEDIQRLVPALQITPSNTGTQSFVIRGSFAEQFTDPGVVTYVDEVPLDSRVLAYGMFDLASIQQLKGPQGTLFGKNSTGGAVLFFTKKPTHEQGGYVQYRRGNFNEQRFEGAFNQPVSDTLAVRLAGQWEERDGFNPSTLDSGKDYANRDNYSLRGTALWTPTDRIENQTTLTHYRVDQLTNPNLLVGLAGPCTGPATPGASCMAQPPFNALLGVPNIQPYLAQQQALGRDETINDFAYPDIYDNDAITNITTLEFGPVNLKNILHYSEISQKFGRDFDGTPVDLYHTVVTADIRNYYDELQLFGSLMDDRLEWRVGGVYSFTDTEEQFSQIAFFRPGVNDTETDATSKALFAQVSYDLSALLDGLKVTAGYRHTWDKREVEIRDLDFAPLACGVPGLPTTTPVEACVRKLEDDFDDFNYNVTFDWAINEQLFAYLATRRGYKSGGFNTATNIPEFLRFDPEIVEDIELGLKSDWRLGDVPVRANIAIYEAKYKSIQTVGLDVSTGSPSQIIINENPVTGKSNDATFKGFEIELSVAPFSWWELSAFYAEVDAQYDRSVTILQGALIDRSGEDISLVIPKTQGVSTRFTPAVPAELGTLSLSLHYFNAAEGNEAAGNSWIKPRREQFDARIDLRDIAGSGIDFGIYAKNLTDNVACEFTDLGFGLGTELCGPPRQFGVEIGYRFGSER